MSTFLQLAQRVAREAGASSIPTTVLTTTGEAGRIVNWTSSAWEDIQLARPNWYWMRDYFTLTLTPSDNKYSSTDASIASRFGMWDVKSLRIYKTTATDETTLNFMNYEDFRSTYMVGPQNTGRPVAFTIDPALNLLFGPVPDYAYTVNGEYYKSVQTMSLDSDEPEMPSQFHMAIVYRALMLYARYESAGEIFDDANTNYKRFLSRIEYNQMPSIEASEPLV